MYRQLIHLRMDEHKGKDHTLLTLQRRGRQKYLKRAKRVLVVKPFQLLVVVTMQQIRTQKHQVIMINPSSKGKRRLLQLNPYLPLNQREAYTCQTRVILYMLLCAIPQKLVSKVTAGSCNSKSRY